LPNQFWRHKNHAVVIDALAAAGRRGTPVHVVLTGKGEDYRAPGYYDELMQRVSRLGLDASFRHLGVVAFSDLMGLMRDAVAMINPSLFEGWSTTVEEARSLGKLAILSDIDVHREQAPPGAQYFAARDSEALATSLIDVWRTAREEDDTTRRRDASAALVARTDAFARRYAGILGAAVQRHRGGR
jgi:glycosyltransferase involved in cell wall biosynthesis